MSEDTRPVILLVDDEKQVVDGLALTLRKEFQTVRALSGADALAVMGALKKVAVVICDMQMPQMNGAALLAQFRDRSPDTTRVLLTGEARRDALVAAVNDGQIFRFLTKPCPPERLLHTVQAAVAHHQQVTAERSVLRETLLGCIQALTDVLALTHPVAYGQASRLRREVKAFAGSMGWDPSDWELEAATMLSQIGYLSLPAELVVKAYDRQPLTADEQSPLAGVPEIAGRLLSHIPRLGSVVQILDAVSAKSTPLVALGDSKSARAARILGLIMDFDLLITQGYPPETAIQILHSRRERHAASDVQSLARFLNAASSESVVVEVPLRQLRTGMIVLEDLHTDRGVLLVAHGFEVNERFLERTKALTVEMLSRPVKVRVAASTRLE